jgi:hypothetical protein
MNETYLLIFIKSWIDIKKRNTLELKQILVDLF